MRKRTVIIAILLGVTAISFAFYTTSEVAFTRSVDEGNQDQISYINFNLVSPAPTMDSTEFKPAFDLEINTFLNRWDIKGASVAVMKDNRLIYAQGYGVTNKNTQEQVQTEHLFRIASASKLITAITIMKMVDDGLVDLDENVFGTNGILSHFDQMKDPKHKNVKVKHLLNHRGGWSWRDGDFMFQADKIKRIMELEGPPSEDDIIEFVLKHRSLRYRPGTQYAYSNFGYMLLGKIIEQKTNTSYENYVVRNILEPNGIYGMRISGNYEWERRPFEVHYYNHPGAYQFPSFDGNYEAVEKPYGGSDIHTLGAAGGWIANASQLTKLVALIDPNNSYQLLSNESRDLMVSGNSYRDAYGWKGARGENFWRTGTLAGSACFIQRKEDGYTYAVILNSSVWMGHRFNNYIKWMMDEAILELDNDKRNLFYQDHQSPSILPLAI
ncbi:CubicO group peptidase, beta-lactamase class C family [Marivirga sericea]|uniref:CubicO group peptidase, beta-lactamase class C family n=1 Tax=Marivirga sericea TaxID=1028 RepID=A0A1X7II76_9BACT|nr:serine hydrolase domain-containing protein [Marivirga sericea]SMG14284.1 CubicO group peptidase, beta-lactamase class C family [Marivirga sericea]